MRERTEQGEVTNGTTGHMGSGRDLRAVIPGVQATAPATGDVPGGSGGAGEGTPRIGGRRNRDRQGTGVPDPADHTGLQAGGSAGRRIGQHDQPAGTAHEQGHPAGGASAGERRPHRAGNIPVRHPEGEEQLPVRGEPGDTGSGRDGPLARSGTSLAEGGELGDNNRRPGRAAIDAGRDVPLDTDVVPVQQDVRGVQRGLDGVQRHPSAGGRERSAPGGDEPRSPAGRHGGERTTAGTPDAPGPGRGAPHRRGGVETIRHGDATPGLRQDAGATEAGPRAGCSGAGSRGRLGRTMGGAERVAERRHRQTAGGENNQARDQRVRRVDGRGKAQRGIPRQSDEPGNGAGERDQESAADGRHERRGAPATDTGRHGNGQG